MAASMCRNKISLFLKRFNSYSACVQNMSSRVLSGIQPTGIPHIGNYLGAIKNWVALQDQFDDVLYTIVDLHAVTVPYNPIKLRENIYLMAASLLACGIDTNKSIMFQQSQVPHHTDLAWLLGCICTIPKLQHLPQWKEKSKSDNPGVGLFTYPVLQAADILIYRATHVPVGEDQLLHLELTRELAKLFNNKYGYNFPQPRSIIGEGPRIKNLQNASAKMSKSDQNIRSRIDITDTPDQIVEKIKKAQTDMTVGISYDPKNRPGISNLLDIHSGLTGESLDSICEQCKSLNKVEYKAKLGEIIIEHLRPIREEVNRLLNDKPYLDTVLLDGSEKASKLSKHTWTEIQKKIGFL